MHIGQRIKEVREKRGKTLLQVANHLGVTEATVQRYESGNIKNLKLDTIAKIALFLNINPAYLMGWEEDEKDLQLTSEYNYFPAAISAGLPINVDGITDDQLEKISLPDLVMGKWAGKQDIFITKINGDSMDKIMPHGSLIAVKPITLNELKDGDMVVFSSDYDYSVKCFYQDGERLIFRPESYNKKHVDQIYSVEDNIEIHGKVVLYIVERD